MKKLFSFITAAAILSAATIKVGISPDYPPFDALENGKVSGFDVELMQHLAKINGDEIAFKTMNFDGLIAALKAGKIDAIISAMSASDQRKKSCDFSDVYYQAKTIFIKNKSSKLSNIEELKGLKVGTQLGTVQEAAMKTLGAKVVSNENPTVLMLALNDGKIDAIAIDALVGREFLAKNPNLVEFYSQSDGTEGFSIAFDKGKHPDLVASYNKALKEFKASDEYSKLLEKYKIQ